MMAFEGLAGKLQAALKRLTGKGKLNGKRCKGSDAGSQIGAS